MRRWWWAVLAVLLTVLSAACAPPERKPAGAPPFQTVRPVGANEQLTPTPTTSAAADADVATAKPAPEPAATKLTDPFTCPERASTPGTSAQLRDALENAEPGDAILLAPRRYSGIFTITAKGTAKRPIYLCGPAQAILDGPNVRKGYVLHLDGATHWRLSGFTVRDGLKGIMMDGGRSNVLQDLTVEATGDEGVHLRANSVGNVVQGLTVHRTGKTHPKFGEGIYVGTAESNWCEVTGCQPDRSDRNQLLGNKITLTTAESIDVKEGTSKGVISGNSFDGRSFTGDTDSWVDVKGNSWTITKNRGEYSPKDGFQTHQILAGWGDRNVFTDNTAKMTGGASGYGIFLAKPLSNRVACSNQQEAAAKGLSNRPCSS